MAALLLAAQVGPALAQIDLSDEPLLASAVSELDIELRGRYVRQWTQENGTLVLVFSGLFRLDMGERNMSSDNAVVWIEPRRMEPDQRKYYSLTVYLSGNAEVCEVGGTVTIDSVLLVRGLQTTGSIVKQHDAHSVENMEQSLLYQEALCDRELIERGEAPPRAPGQEVAQPIRVRRAEVERVRRVITYRSERLEPAETPAGERVVAALGDVYVAQRGGPDAPMLEIRADAAVIFLAEGLAASVLGEEVEPTPADQAEPEAGPPLLPPPPEEGQPPALRRPGEEPGTAFGLAGADQQVRGVFLEGDVVLSLGNRFVRANRLYYDFENDRALILDAVMRADIPEREVPLYVRAAEIRQLSTREFAAENAMITTSEFYTPSYHIGAERVYLRDTTPRDAQGRASGPISARYKMHDMTLNVGNVPLLWWPYGEGDLEASETLIRGVSAGYTSDRGVEVETSWNLFNLMGIDRPKGYDAALDLDYYSERGPGVGVRSNYEAEDHFGYFRGRFQQDDGEDSLGPLRRANEDPDTNQRGRILWRHRHYLPRDWEATVELAYASDPFFLEEYEKEEWFEDKMQETVLYLKRARDVEAITMLANWRTLDFTSQTEHLPELTYRRIGDTFLSPALLYHESRIGAVRYLTPDYQPSDLPFRIYTQRQKRVSIFDEPGGTDTTFRVDARQEAELPLKLGPVKIVPFVTVRGSFWDGQPTASGGLWRGLGVYGVRGGTSFSRVYDGVESELFDIHRLRHIIKPGFAAWYANSNTRSELLTPYDYGIETIDAFYGTTFSLRQTWQTMRGAPGKRRTVDLFKFDLEAGFFGNTDGRNDFSNGFAYALRPENSRTRNYIAGELTYRISDSTAVLYDFNIDIGDWTFDRHNISVAVERSPRVAYLVGARFAGDIDMSLVGGGWNYRLNEKHLTAVRAWYDFEAGDVGEISFGYVRKLPRWYVGVKLNYDNVDDVYSVSLSLWPEGAPEWAIGSREYTDLASTTAIQP